MYREVLLLLVEKMIAQKFSIGTPVFFFSHSRWLLCAPTAKHFQL
jgi:hypothetical protein